MQVKFWNYAKRNNSTATPSDSLAVSVDCVLKAPTNVMTPTLELTGLTWLESRTYIRYNYAYIGDFLRYYVIKNWHFVNAKLVADLEVDVLASYKTNIRASSQYVLRSASSWDDYITDTKYPVKAQAPTIAAGYFAPNPLLPPQNADGVVVVGIVNKTGSITGCITYYALGIYAFSELCSKLFNLSTQWGDGGADIADGIKKAITDPFQYFVSAVWLPYVPVDFTNRGLAVQTNAVFCGYDTIVLSNYAYQFVDSIQIAFTNLITFNVPSHPQTSRGNYMNTVPYSRYFLSFYPFTALCELDSSAFIGQGNLYAVYTVDLRTGKAICSICKDYVGSSFADWQPSQIIRAFEAQVGVSIPIAAIHTALPQSIADGKMMAIGAGATAVSNSGGFKQTLKKLWATSSQAIGSLFGADQETMQSAYDIIGAEPFNAGDVSKIVEGTFAAKQTVELSGSQGTMSFNYRTPIAFWAEFVNAVDDNVALNGRPLCQTVALSTLSGFVCCDNPHIIAAGAYPSEIAEIENMLASGIFLE